MSDSDEVLFESDLAAGPIVDVTAVEAVVDRIRAADNRSKWRSNVILSLKSRRWRPDAVTESREAVLHVCLTGEILKHIVVRMEEARACGMRVIVALTLNALYSPDILRVLAAIDADVYVVEDPVRAVSNLSPRHFMAAIADLGVPTASADRIEIMKAVYNIISIGTNYEKGRRFEALLAYLLSQVTDFRVVERNLRTETQELDIVVQIDRLSQRSWQQGVPYMLVEAKNWTEHVPQPVVAGLMSKVRTKGQACKMALLIATSGFTSDALQEELRYSESENRIAMLGPTELRSLIEAIDLDGTLDVLVRRALFR